MGALKDRMLENLRLRNMSEKTIKAYLYHVSGFTRYFGKAPDLLGEEEVRKYLLYLLDERKTSWSNVNQSYAALRFFYVETLNRDWQVKKIPRPKGEKHLPVVLSQKEVKALFDATYAYKHRVIFQTIYSAGLRVSEACQLKPQHIESDSKRIRVEQGKGKKDRYTILSEMLLQELRSYWLACRPTEWLFFGQKKNKPISKSSVQQAFSRAKKKPASTKPLQFTPSGTALQPTFWSRALTY